MRNGILTMPPPAAVKTRVQSIDILRGIVMIIMALDHTRDFFHNKATTGNPLDPATTTGVLYFTRWITHFCAPTFVFLAGCSAYLVGLRKTKKQLSSFLLKRGLWLILAEAVLISFGLTFDPTWSVVFFSVIWAIGISMVILAALVFLPFRVLFVIGALIVLGHDLLDYPEAAANGNVGFLWKLLHGPGLVILPFATGHMLAIAYHFLPWLGIMIMGYCTGKLFVSSVDPVRRSKTLLTIGFGLIVLFIILRWINLYGNPFPWAEQKTALQTFFSFMNVNKYPPSLMYTCATVGPALILLSLIEGVQNKFTSFVQVYGRVPFFYYALHLYLIHIFVIIAFYATGHTNAEIREPNAFILFRPAKFGFDLWAVYLIWMSVVLLLYPLCKWYNKYKSTHDHWWLSYV